MIVEAWHFSRQFLRFDLRYTPVEKGLRLTCDSPLILCNRGLHGSVKALDALDYAPGPIVSRVVCSGEIKYGRDKIVASERTHVAVANATNVLKQFAKECALEVIHLWDPPQVVLDYLKTGNEKIGVVADDTARVAARYAVAAAARAATRDAVVVAARDAAWGAARAAAAATARYAAAAAAWDAARENQNKRLEKLLCNLLEITND